MPLNPSGAGVMGVKIPQCGSNARLVLEDGVAEYNE
jgi:hypothetical protein